MGLHTFFAYKKSAIAWLHSVKGGGNYNRHVIVSPDVFDPSLYIFRALTDSVINVNLFMVMTVFSNIGLSWDGNSVQSAGSRGLSNVKTLLRILNGHYFKSKHVLNTKKYSADGIIYLEQSLFTGKKKLFVWLQTLAGLTRWCFVNKKHQADILSTNKSYWETNLINRHRLDKRRNIKMSETLLNNEQEPIDYDTFKLQVCWVLI